jgi:hypothetical protein
MQRVWFRAFIPAIGFTIVGLLLLAYAASIQQLANVFDGAYQVHWLFGGVSVALLALLVCWHY